MLVCARQVCRWYENFPEALLALIDFLKGGSFFSLTYYYSFDVAIYTKDLKVICM
jgi:hypothetical protein